MNNITETISKINKLIFFDRKKTILENSQLIVESEIDEMREYFKSYLKSKDCLDIGKDMKTYQNDIESGKVKVSPSNKTALDNAIIEFDKHTNFEISLGCGTTIKPMMRDKFEEALNSDKEGLKTQLCWFSKGIYVKSLSFCNTQQVQQTNNVTPSTNQIQKTDNNVQTPMPTPTPTAVPERKASLNPNARSPINLSNTTGL